MYFLKFNYMLIAGVGILLLVALAGCRQSAPKAATAPVQKAGEHVAHHGGCLNAVVTCENGHAETKIDGDRLQCWFVGGGPNTGTSVPIGDKSITLKVKLAGASVTHTLVLQAKPLKLAEETLGHCSYFEGRASWLTGMSAFVADGTLRQYRGKAQPLHIEYPKGYDPD